MQSARQLLRFPSSAAAGHTFTRSFTTTRRANDFARVQLLGRVGTTPEVVETKGEQQLTRYAIAVNTGKPESQHTSWYNISAFGEQAGTRLAGIPKGSLVLVDASMQINTYQDEEEGKKHISVRMVQRGITVMKKPQSEGEGESE